MFRVLKFNLLTFILMALSARAQEEISVTASPVNPPSQESSAHIQVREQPPMQVYSVPLSSQEKLSQARRRAEQQTEDKIRSRLETMRLKEEQERLSKILTPLEDENVVTHTSSSPEPSEPSSIDPSYERKTRFFIQLEVGKLYYFLQAYPQITYNNFQFSNNYLQILSLGLGVYFSRISLEYSPHYSSYRLLYTGDIYNNVKLYSHELAAKFYFHTQSSSVRPFIGILAAFQNRTYQTDQAIWNKQILQHTGGLARDIFTWQGRKSHTLQAGMVAGLEAHLNSQLTIGAEMRGFVNVYDLEDRWNQQNVYYYQVFPNSPSPEEWSWYRLHLYARYLF